MADLFDVAELADRLREEQQTAWRRGERPLTEDVFREHPALAADSEAALDFIYGEFCLREEAGDRPTNEEYLQRFPQYAAELTVLFRLHEALRSSQLAEAQTADLGPPRGNARREQPTIAWSDTSRVSPEMALISTHGGSGTKDSAPPPNGASSAANASTPRFQILRLHAKGGLGEVFVARDGELNRDVALKEIQSQFAGDPDRRSRFMLEAEITGGLEHPGVVPVYALGTYPDGRPFYAMRFLKGHSLHEAALDFHASPASDWGLCFRQLLRRFLDVCNAMQYAHDRGVLHRDLKPANVVLGDYGETMVVDWGLAKPYGRTGAPPSPADPLQPAAIAAVEATQLNSIVGTPCFMSPEQASGDPVRMGPASDVFSLGATLYFVLTGKTPFTGRSVTAVLHKVRTGDFPRPRELKSDLSKAIEAICLKAMSLKIEDRYLDARSLAKDLESWLADEPVTAYREQIVARTRRWVRKHPGQVTGIAATVVLSLLSSAALAYVNGKHAQELSSKNVTITRQKGDLEQSNLRLASETAKAQAAERAAILDKEKAAAAELVAVKEKEQAEAATSFLASSFRNVDPDRSGRNLTVYEVLTRASEELVEDSKLDPLQKANLLQALGTAFLRLGLHDEAISNSERTLTIRREHLGDDDPVTLTSLNEMASAHYEAGKFNDARMLFEELNERERRTLGDDHPDTRKHLSNLAVVYQSLGKRDLALPLFKELWRVESDELGPADPATLKNMSDYAACQLAAGNVAQALPLMEEALKLTKAALGDQHSRTLGCMSNLASAYRAIGKPELAIPLYEEAWQKGKDRLGEDHPDTLSALSMLAVSHDMAGKPELALQLYEETLRRRKVKLGEDHPATLTSMNNVAQAYKDAGKLNLAVPLFEETLKRRRVALGDDHPHTLNNMNCLALAYETAGNLDLALPLMEECAKLSKAKLGEFHPDTINSMNTLAIGYGSSGKLEQAVPMFEECLRLHREKFGDDHHATLNSLANLAGAYAVSGRLEAAVPLYEESLRLTKARFGGEHPKTLAAMNELGYGYTQVGKFELALPLYEEALRLRNAKFGDEHPATLQSMKQLGIALLKAKSTAAGIGMSQDFLGRWKKQAPSDLQWALHASHVAVACVECSQFAEAERIYREILPISETQQAGSANLGNVKSELGGAVAAQKRFEDAESILIAGFEGLESAKDAAVARKYKANLSAAAKRLVDLYSAWDKPEKAKEWQAKLDALSPKK